MDATGAVPPGLVSGVPLVVLADVAGEVARLVHALHVVEQADLPEHALVGGLAVMARLTQAHRVTTDIDQSVRSDDPDLAAELLLVRDAGATRSTNGVLLSGAMSVDLISIGDVRADELPDDELLRTFVLAHDYALATAQPVTIQARRGRASIAEATVRVATAAALVACKSQAPFTRKGMTVPAKRGTDVLDLYRLLQEHPDVGRQLQAAEHGLGQLVGTCVDRLLINGVDRAARDLRALGGVAAGITADDLHAAGTLLLAQLIL